MVDLILNILKLLINVVNVVKPKLANFQSSLMCFSERNLSILSSNDRAA